MSGNTTYHQFKNSLGNFVYMINVLYLYTINQTQLASIISYSKYDSSGNQNLKSVIPTISPYQYQSSLYIDLTKKNILIDGRDYVRFNVLPNAIILLKVYVDRIAVSDPLDMIEMDNFKKLEFANGQFNFFEKYTKYIK